MERLSRILGYHRPSGSNLTVKHVCWIHFVGLYTSHWTIFGHAIQLLPQEVLRVNLIKVNKNLRKK